MDSKPNYYVRTLIVILVLGLIALISYSFAYSEPKFVISGGIITVLLIAVVLVLSESFNQLNIGKLLSLKREITKKTEENALVKEDNKELRQNLFNIISNIQQSQVNNTFNAPPEAWLKLLGVVPSDKKPDDTNENEQIQPEVESQQEDTNRDEIRLRFRLRRASEKAGLNKFVQSLAIPESSIIYNAEFSTAFHGIDPIMDRRVVFDGYIKGGDVERFVEVKLRETTSPMFFDSLYIMLSKIHLYRQAKNTNAELILLLVSNEIEDETRAGRHTRLLEYFQPAIANKLLRIELINVSNTEVETEVEQDSRN